MDINLESTFAVPPMFHRYDRGEWALLFDPRNSIVVRANAQGIAVVEAFMRHPVLRDAIQYIAESYAMSFEQVAKPVIDFALHLVNAGFLHEGAYRQKVYVEPENDKLEPPGSLYIQNTERCNLSCVYCYNREERTYFVNEHREMSTEQMKWALDQMVDFGIPQFNFCGGEPTLRDDLLEVAAHARSRGRYVCLVTNGRLDSDEFTREAARLFDVIWVSIDSHNKETAEKHRGKGSWEPAMNSIRKLAKVPDRKAKLTVSAVASHLNWQELGEFRRVCIDEIGVDRFRATTYSSGCAASAEANWALQPPPFVKDQSISFPGDVEFSDLTDFDNIQVEYDVCREQLRTPSGMRNHCGVGKGEMAMLSNGDIFPCQLLCMPQYLVGNIFEQPVREMFYQSPVLKRLRGLTVDTIPGCATCDVKYVCAGGCRANALETHGSITAHNSYHCDFYHRLAIDSLWKDAMIPVQRITEARKIFQEKVAAARAEKEAAEKEAAEKEAADKEAAEKLAAIAS